MAELSDEKIKAIRDHLFAVAELLGDVPGPGPGRPKFRADRTPRVGKLQVVEAIGLQGHGLFTCRTLQEVLTARGVRISAAALSNHLVDLKNTGRLESPLKGYYRTKAANGHG
jgi:hypothetical protein